jgi:nitroreductase
MRSADTTAPLLPYLAERWSPRSFDPEYALPEDDLTTLLEAARWAASASNTQPWKFIVGLRGSATFDRIAERLMGFNAVWAGSASALITVAAQLEDANGKPLRWSHYDAGQAAAQLTVQAHALGLHVHSMGGIEWDAINADFELGEVWDVLTVLAVGKAASADLLNDKLKEREQLPRERKPLSDIVIR